MLLCINNRLRCYALIWQRQQKSSGLGGIRVEKKKEKKFEVDINHMEKVQHTIIIIIICEWLESLAITNIINTFFHTIGGINDKNIDLGSLESMTQGCSQKFEEGGQKNFPFFFSKNEEISIPPWLRACPDINYDERHSQIESKCLDSRAKCNIFFKIEYYNP